MGQYFPVMELMANISEDAIVLRPDDVKGHVQFRDVSFGYPDKAHAIQHIDLNVPAGSIIGILGGTGSGKVYHYQPADKSLQCERRFDLSGWYRH